MILNRENALNFLGGLPRWAKGLTAVDERVLWSCLMKTVSSVNLLVLENRCDDADQNLSLMFTSCMIMESLLLYFRKNFVHFPHLRSANTIKFFNAAVGYAKTGVAGAVTSYILDCDRNDDFVTGDMTSRINAELSGLTESFRQDYAGYLAVLDLNPSELEKPTFDSLTDRSAAAIIDPPGSRTASGVLDGAEKLADASPIDEASLNQDEFEGEGEGGRGEPDGDEATSRAQVSISQPHLHEELDVRAGHVMRASRAAGDPAANKTVGGWDFFGCC